MIGPLRPTDPATVGGFTLTGRLGEGAQGTVFLGVSDTGEKVAVKLLHSWVVADPHTLRRFRRELAAVERVAPFCTARILASDVTAEHPYIVSEYVDGPSLQQLISEGRDLGGTDLERLAIGTATALAAIHEAGVVHRDFKPGNVLIGSSGPRVIDFGIARPLDATAMTASGAIGTPSYMAPEQLAGAPAQPPLDLFAWACTIAAAANGRPPFGNDTIPAVITRIVNDPPDLGRLTGRLREVISTCLEKDPDRRPTARHVLLALLGSAEQEDLLTSGTVTAARLTPPSSATAPASPPSPSSAPPPSAPPPSAPAPSAPAPFGQQPYAQPPYGQPPYAQPPYGQPPYVAPAFVPASNAATTPSTTPAPPYPVPVRPQRRGSGRTAAIAAGVAVAALVVGVGTAVILDQVLDEGNGGQSGRTASGAQTASGAPSTTTAACTYLPPLAGTEPDQRAAGTPPPRPKYSGTVRASMATSRGTIVMDLDAAKAPCTVNSFAHLAERGFYDSLSCHRLSTVTALRILQCGDPGGKGTGGPGYRFADENRGAADYPRGTVAMSRSERTDTNGSQFFIVYDDIEELSGNYTVFGKVVSSLKVVEDLAAHGTDDSESDGAGRPNRSITIKDVTLTPRS
ncbi:protein kinase domain-containing protein [Actinomadura alba]|uniref:Peptidylprolyl isomerase n=1 Tax=Actinomadura alba TaxID=406431 RepID=A0ABR7M209_9ACTN|nr:peptidylprolyl isomerase [Actinomadura alba]MBC6470727.1 peptidylprolyl isomerase [Actinomadura alba]